MTITEISIKRPILIIVVFSFLGILGFASYQQLNYELLPDITPPYISVITMYPGASPAEVEDAVTRKVEDAVANTEQSKRVFSTSTENTSIVWVEFNQSADGDVALQNVQRRVNEIHMDLPEAVKEPVLSKFSMNDIPVLRIAATSTLDARAFTQLLEERISPRLSRQPGVGAVTLIGTEKREIQILLDADRLRLYGISTLQVVDALHAADLDVPAGSIKDTDAEFSIRTLGRSSHVETLRGIAVAGNGSDGIFLRDVAEVTDGSADRVSISRLNGEAAAGILIQKQSDGNTVEVSRAVRSELDRLEHEFAADGLHFELAQDASDFTLRAAHAVNKDLALAVLLVALIMLLFLHSFRNALIVLVAIPASLISTFIAMWAFGFTLNLMTLLAMSLVIGILVDDSIVVLENIHRHLEMEKEPARAALEGRYEIGFTALAITLVDVVVFVPMILVGGIVGGLLREFSGVIVTATLLSLFVSFTLTPMLAARFSRVEKLAAASRWARFGRTFETCFQRMTEHYVRLLRLALRHRFVTALTALALLAASFALVGFGFIGNEFVTMADKGEFTMTVTLPPGTPIQHTDSLARRIEEQAMAFPEVRRVFTYVGVSNEGVLGMNSSNAAEITVTLCPVNERSRSVQDVGDDMRNFVADIPGVNVRVVPVGFMGMAGDAPIQLVINNTNLDSLYAAAERIRGTVEEIPGTADVRLSSEAGKPEMHVDVDHARMAALGVTTAQVGNALRVMLAGYDDMEFRENGSVYPMRIRLSEADRRSTDALERFAFVSASGRIVELEQFAHVHSGTGPTVLDRRNRIPAVTLYAQAEGRPAGNIGEDITAALAGMQLPAGTTVGFEGDLEAQEESFGSLGLAFLAAILFVYLIMAALYDSFTWPFVVLFSIPLAIIGVLFALAFTMSTLSIFSMFGIIMMIGLVAKNAILLVDRTNQLRAEGMDRDAAILTAGRQRLRPILMTTLTMVFGLLPIALASGAGAEWKNSLAWALIGGLTSSLLLTLVLIPTLYLDFDRLRGRIHLLQGSVRALITRRGAQMTGGIVLLLLLAAMASAQPASMTLDDVLAAVDEANPQLAISRLEAERASQQLRAARGALLPTVGIDARYVYNIQPPVIFFPTVNVDPVTGALNFTEPSTPVEIGLNHEITAGIRAELPLLAPAAWAGIRAARALRRAATADVQLTRTELRAGAAELFVSVLVLKERDRLLQEDLQRTTLLLAETVERSRQGMATAADTLEIQAQKSARASDLRLLRSSIDETRSALAVLMGLPPTELPPLEGALLPPDTPVAAEGMTLGDALRQRPEMNRLNAMLSAVEARRDAASAGHLPVLSAFGSWQVQDQANDMDFSSYRWPKSSWAGLQLSIPLFSGWRTSADAQRAEIAVRQARLREKDLRNSIDAEIRSARAREQDLRVRVETRRDEEHAIQRRYELVYARWKQGLETQIVLTDAELSWTRARTQYLSAIYDWHLADIALRKAAGLLLPLP